MYTMTSAHIFSTWQNYWQHMTGWMWIDLSTGTDHAQQLRRFLEYPSAFSQTCIEVSVDPTGTLIVSTCNWWDRRIEAVTRTMSCKTWHVKLLSLGKYYQSQKLCTYTYSCMHIYTKVMSIKIWIHHHIKFASKLFFTTKVNTHTFLCNTTFKTIMKRPVFPNNFLHS